MIEIVILICYICIFLICRTFFKQNLSLLFLPPLLITSGDVYISSVLSILIILYIYIMTYKVNKKVIIYFTLITSLTLLLASFQKSYEYDLFEIVQLLCFCFIILQVITKHDKISLIDFKSINLGFYAGAVFIVLGLFVRSKMSITYNQEEFDYLSISHTFNYTSYYLFFGLIISPIYLNFKKKYKIISFVLYLLAVIIFQARASLILGLGVYTLLNFPKTRLKKALLIISSVILIYILIKVFTSYGFLDVENQNDIIYSTVNFENNVSNIARLNMLKNSIVSMLNTPFGWGIGRSGEALNYYGISAPHAHNLIGNWLYEMGIGGVFFSVLFYYSLYKMYRINNQISKINILAIAVFIVAYSIIDSLQYNILMSLITLMGFILMSSRSENRNLKSKKIVRV